MSIKKQLIWGLLFVGIVIVLPTQVHASLNDYKQFRKALGSAKYFNADTTEIVSKHKNHYMCKKYIKDM